MVASSLSGIPSSFSMIWLLFDLEFLMVLISAGDKEKKAASAPETKADRINNTNNGNKGYQQIQCKRIYGNIKNRAYSLVIRFFVQFNE